MRSPTFHLEKQLAACGYSAIAGVDEVGCGALAGPVLAAAVILPVTSRLGRIRDSKMLSPIMRAALYSQITVRAAGWAVGQSSVAEITALGLRPATLLAMRRAVDQLNVVDYVLVDAWTLPALPIPQQGLIRGDQSVKSIAAASIIAKVTRDRMMAEYAIEYPGYGFEKHKGYGTAFHQSRIQELGPCAIHRLSYKTFA